MSHAVAQVLPFWSIIPFAGMLLSIALFPLINAAWWEHHQLSVALVWSVLFAVPFGIIFGPVELIQALLESLVLDYIPFIVLLFGLFVVAGGIALQGTLVGTTKLNVILLVIGTLLSSFIGTTGAAMLLIRPMIRANAWRKYRAHIVIFFIFLVANIGGCLTPLGDPPLFLGYLRGVPFFWTLHLFPLLLINLAVLLPAFIAIDRRYYKKELAEGRSPQDMIANKKIAQKIKVVGLNNLWPLAMVIAAVILNGVLPSDPAIHLFGFEEIKIGVNYLVQIVLILFAAWISFKTTRTSIRQLNGFTFGPIKEVAILFIGIFITMIPALALLKTHGSALGLVHPAQYFWATGMLSAFLDNSPTYVVFLTTAASLSDAAHQSTALITTLGPVAPAVLLAVSAGAVFMGALTYIGNAPNFMVKAIAEENGIKMPSFFGYMAWSVGLLVPTFIIVTLIAFVLM